MGWCRYAARAVRAAASTSALPRSVRRSRRADSDPLSIGLKIDYCMPSGPSVAMPAGRACFTTNSTTRRAMKVWTKAGG